MIGSLLSLCVGFLCTAILTRLISTVEMGKYSMYTTVGTLVVSIVYLGLDQAYVRFYFEEKEGARQNLLKKCLTLPLMLTVVVSVGILLFYRPFSTYVIGEESILLTALFCVYMFGLVVDRFLLLKVRMLQKAFIYSFLNVTRKVSYLGLAIILFYYAYHDTSWSLIVPVTIAEIFVIFGALWAGTSKSSVRKEGSKTSNAELVKYGLPFIFSTTVTILFHSTDKFMLKSLMDYNQIGLYTGAQNIVNLLTQVQNIFSTFWVPVAFEHFSNKANDSDFFIRINKIISYVMLVLFLIILCAKDIIIYFLGERYRNASFIFPFLAFMPIMYTVSETTVIGINFMKKTSYHVWISLCCVIVNAIGNFFLIRQFGAIGAAISTGLSYVVFFLLRTILSNTVYPVKYATVRFLVACVFVAALAGIASFSHVTWWYVIIAFGLFLIISFMYKDILTDLFGYVRLIIGRVRGEKSITHS